MSDLASTSLVECEGVGLVYGSGHSEVRALRQVTCTVSAGARLAITGPSGSGKSTLLHLMAGLERPTTGNVRWHGLGGDPTGRPGVVGVVFQGPSLIPALDVIENVALPLVLSGMTDTDARELALVAMRVLEIEALASKLPEELSGGQSQRAAIARVLATRPALILADEPTGQLDRTTAAHVMDVLVQVADEIGAAVVVSTHDPLVADRLPQAWRMRDGLLDAGASTQVHPVETGAAR